MELIGYVSLALLIGLSIGLGLGAVRRRAADGATTAGMESRLDVQSAELRRLADAAAARELTGEQLRSGLEAARRTLDELRVRELDRREVDGEHREVVRRLATVLAGGAAQGRAGEHMLRDQLAALPPDLLVSDFRVNGKVVEFGLLLPDGRRLPIDSKWTAVGELEALEAATDVVDRDARARAVEKAVTARAREVASYLDPAVTAPVALAAVPDAAYAALKRAHADAYAKGVVIVPYSSALPIVLFLHSLVRRYGDAADVQATLAEVAGLLDLVEAVIENKVVRAATMLTNGADELRSHVGKARGSIARAHAATDEPDPAGVELTVVG